MSDSAPQPKWASTTSNTLVLGILGTVVGGLLTWMAISYFGNVSDSVQSIEEDVTRIQDDQRGTVQEIRKDAARMHQAYNDSLQTMKEQVSTNKFANEHILRILDKSQVILEQIPVINQKILYLESRPDTSPEIRGEIKNLRVQLEGLKQEVEKLGEKLRRLKPPNPQGPEP